MTKHLPQEINCDALIGPTHHYAGLAQGNMASMYNRQHVANPRAAALQGLNKMKHLATLGIPQVVLPPAPRPHLSVLRRLGFRGKDAQIIATVAKTQPDLLSKVYSASSMWAANAATTSASSDSDDQRVHITPANLLSHDHRALESSWTATMLEQVFPSSEHDNDSPFVHHPTLPSLPSFADEGAANHMRLNQPAQATGLHIFVYGRHDAHSVAAQARYPARQQRDASHAIARLHRLSPARCFFVQQHPKAIDAGVFHNDVIAVSHKHLLLYHEDAWVDTAVHIAEWQRALNDQLIPLCVSRSQMSYADSVQSYLFNAQIVSLSNTEMRLIAPHECTQIARAKQWINTLIEKDKTPIKSVDYVDLRQSMRNGGGPACLRLRLWLSTEEQAYIHTPCIWSPHLHSRLEQWVNRHYRERLIPTDLGDPKLIDEVQKALSELAQIFQLPQLYSDFF